MERKQKNGARVGQENNPPEEMKKNGLFQTPEKDSGMKRSKNVH